MNNNFITLLNMIIKYFAKLEAESEILRAQRIL